MPRDVAVVLSNGSTNGAVCGALAAQRARVVLVHVDATPDAPSAARAAFERQAAAANAEAVVLAAPWLRAVPGDAAAADDAVTAKLVALVPALAAGLRLACGRAGATLLCVGLRVGPGADLAPALEHVQIWGELAQLTLARPALEITAPLLELEPWQVVDLGRQIAAPLDATWDCDASAGPEPCRACAGCRRRGDAYLRATMSEPGVKA